MRKKLIRVAAVSGSLRILLKGQLRYMNSYYEVVGVASDDPNHEIIRKEEGIRTIPLKISRRINFFQDVVSLFKLYFLFKKEKPFIVHSITPKAGLLSMIAAYLAGVPHRLHTFTGLVFPSRTGNMQKLLIFFDRMICRCATQVFPEGQGVKNDLINYRITNKELRIIGHGNVNGIDVAHFNPTIYSDVHILAMKKELNIKPDDFVFLFVGRLVSEKGISELISAFTDIMKKHSKVKLVLVGHFEKKLDPLPSHIESEILKNHNIIAVGWQNDVRPYFALANVFVFPSYREGFPNVLLQACAMGIFSIVTNINGSNEIIENDKNGVIVPPKNTPILFKEMEKCLLNKSKHVGTNMEIRKLISEKYDNDIIWSALLRTYKALD
jgi:glycosyltransferase involved in cell wall biosynthesis